MADNADVESKSTNFLAHDKESEETWIEFLISTLYILTFMKFSMFRAYLLYLSNSKALVYLNEA